MILVKIDDADHVIEKGKPCIVLCGKLVRPSKMGGSDPERVEFEVVTSDDLPPFPRLKNKVGLVPYPHGTVPSLIVEERRIAKVLWGPVHFLFCIFDTQFDVSQLMGRVFAVEEV
jgi:hypothetical protein